MAHFLFSWLFLGFFFSLSHLAIFLPFKRSVSVSFRGRLWIICTAAMPSVLVYIKRSPYTMNFEVKNMFLEQYTTSRVNHSINKAGKIVASEDPTYLARLILHNTL